MKHKYLLSFFLLLISFSTQAQTWTEPVNISNLNDFVNFSDFTIDNNGTIHCVWYFKYDNNYAVVYYQYSDDDGETWSEPVSVSQNDNYYCVSQRIIHDSENNIYVGYDLNNYTYPNWGSYAYVVKKDSSGWGEPIELSEGINTRLAVDNNNRIYVFWFERAPHYGEFYYQYLENDNWSEVFSPYYSDDNKTSLEEIVIDDSNNLHCVGTFRYSTNSYNRPVYFKYDYENDQWSDLTFLSMSQWRSDCDIVLDPTNYPNSIWGQSNTDRIYHSFFDGIDWSEKEMISYIGEVFSTTIECDSYNELHIIGTELIDYGIHDTVKLVYYHRPDGNNWEHLILDEAANTIFTPELEIYNDKLYLCYVKSDSAPFGDAFLTKMELLTTIEENNHSSNDKLLTLNAYPNPFNSEIQIDISVEKKSMLDIYITDLKGKLVYSLPSPIKINDKYSFTWNGINNKGKKVTPGIYLATIATGNTMKTIKVIYKP